jgi:Bacterial EndoU nuclease
VSVGTSAGSTSAGVGRDGGSASSTTQAAISGIAGNQAARTGDAEAAITPIFDKEAVSKEVNAQAQITAEFGRNASRAVGDYATDKLKEAEARRRQADTEQDPDKKAQLVREAEALEAAWGEGRPARVALHAAVGALTGGIDGAIGAVTSQTAVPVIGEQIAQLDAPEDVKKALVQIAGTTIGLATGGAAGAMTATNATANNYLRHAEITQLLIAQKECDKGNANACSERDSLMALDRRRQEALNACTNVRTTACESTIKQAAADFDGLLMYQQELVRLVAEGRVAYNDIAPFINKARTESRDIAAHLKDYFYLQANGDINSPAWTIAKQLEGMNTEDLANLWNATAAVGAARNVNRPGANNSSTPETPPATSDRPLQQAMDASADSPYNSTGRSYGETTTVGPDGKPVPLTNAQTALNDLASKNVDRVTAPVDFEHVIGADYRRNADGSIKLTNGQAQPTGGHSLTSGDVKIVPGTESAPDASGVYTARVQMPDPNNPGQWIIKPGSNHTMFPREWTADRITVEVDAAWNRRTVNGNIWEGYTPSGVLVRGYLSPRVTVYPVSRPTNP